MLWTIFIIFQKGFIHRLGIQTFWQIIVFIRSDRSLKYFNLKISKKIAFSNKLLIEGEKIFLYLFVVKKIMEELSTVGGGGSIIKFKYIYLKIESEIRKNN